MVASKKDYNVERLMQFAMYVVKNAGERALSFYSKSDPRIRFDESLITETELHLTQFLENQLYSYFPEHQIFSRMSNNMDENNNYSHEENRYMWVFDALDGVANFQAGIPIWGISIALVENFWPVFSVFYMPVVDNLFHAQAGHSAFRGNHETHVTTIDNINDESLLLTFSRFHQHYHPAFPGKIRNLGSTSAHICYVAAGCADGAVIANETYQGLAAAHIIIEAAGGKIYKTDGGEFVLNEYFNGESIQEHLLVTSPQLHAQINSSLQIDPNVA